MNVSPRSVCLSSVAATTVLSFSSGLPSPPFAPESRLARLRAGQGAPAGLTLIELSIVLVIIGLIVGGILVGQDLIKAAEVRAQISQIEKYNQAVNTFQGKFNAIPGDMAVGTASQFGFTVGTNCTGIVGGRNSDGLIQGSISPWFYAQGGNETLLFWTDLSSPVANVLIDGQFVNNGATFPNCNGSPTPVFTTTTGTTYLGDYFPQGKIGHGNFVYVYSTSGYNWFGLSAATGTDSAGTLYSNSSIPVIQTFNIDKKIDDGLPTTGAVQAVFINGSLTATSVPTNAASDTTTTCYNTTSNTYSISSLANYGAGGNCALSFRFQ